MRVAFTVIVFVMAITAASQGSSVTGDQPAHGALAAEAALAPAHADFQRNTQTLLASQRPRFAPTPGAFALGGLGVVVAYRPSARRKRSAATLSIGRARVAAA